jgi:hypothetical protein
MAAGLVALVVAQSAAADDVAVLEQRIEQLEARIRVLEARLEEPLTVKAPFVVAREDGQPLLRVEQDDEGAVLELTSRKGDARVAMHAAPEEATLQVTGPSGRGLIESTRTSMAISVADSDNDPTAESIELVLDSEGSNIKLTHNGHEVAVLGTPEGEENGLRIYDGTGELAVAAGVDEDGPGIALLRGEDEKLAELGKGEGEEVALRIYDASGEPALEAGMRPEGGGIGISMWSGGEPLVDLGESESLEGEGMLRVMRGGRLSVEIGSEKGQPGVRVYDDSEQVAIEASVDSSGLALVAVSKGGNVATSMTVDEAGNGSFDVIGGNGRVATLDAIEGGGSLLLRDDGGNSPGVWIRTLPGGIGWIDVYRGDQFAAQLGPGSSDNTALRIYGRSGAVVAAIGEDAQGHGAVRVANSAGVIVSSMTAGDNGGGVYALADSVPVAGIVAEQGNGVVAVYNATVPVAYLTRSSGGDGGNVTVARNDGFGVFSAGAAQDGGGEACLNRVTGGGEQAVKCLGIDLPSMGLAK